MFGGANEAAVIGERFLRLGVLVSAMAVGMASASPIVTVAWQEPPANSASPGPRPTCPARPVRPADLVPVLRETIPEDPDAENPQGDAVPPAERAAIGELMTVWAACLASGDIPGLLGLFTADGIGRLLAQRSPLLGGPAGLPISILAAPDVVRLRDGRLAARLAIDPSGAGNAPPEPVILVAEQGDDGVWRIDHLLSPIVPGGAVGMAETPSPAPARALLRQPIAPGPGVPIPAPGPTVPMRGADVARTGIQLGPAPDEDPREVWRTPAGWHTDAQPVVARGMIFFGGFSLGERNPLLVAVDAASGGVRWQTTAPVAWAEFPDTPALGGDVLFAPVQAPVAGVMAVAAGTGSPLWFTPFGFTSVTAPAVDADAVYVAGWGVRNVRDRTLNDASGAVFALDQRTGRERWRFLAPARFGPVAVSATTVYVPSERGLFAIDRATGRKRWQARFSPAAGETATVAGDTVVFGGSETTSGVTGVFALDAASGALRWRDDLPAAPGARSGSAAANDAAFVSWWDAPADDPGSGIPSLRAYDLETGELRWVFRAGSADTAGEPVGTGSLTAPVVVSRSVIFGVAVRVPATGASGNADGLYAVDVTSGALRWRTSGAAPIRSAPAVLNGAVYAMGGLRARGGATGGNLFAFNTGPG